MSQVLSLTNKRKIPMVIPIGGGDHVELASEETKLVEGDYETFHNMTRSMNGLVVKVTQGEKTRLVEAAQKQDIVRATVTNHRKIPMLLDTGIGHKTIQIAPGETSQPVQLRVSVVKKMHGISVKVVDEVKTEPPKAEQKKADEKKVEASKADEKKTEAPKVEEKKASKEDEALAKKRADLALPATLVEWTIHKEQMTWPDVRGICKELDIRTKSSSKEELLEEITKALYPS